MKIGDRQIGSGAACYVIAEIGQNHNGDIELAIEMIRRAAANGADAVKFQKRTLELCVPEAQRDTMRETPWGVISYMDYRRHLEFDSLSSWRAIVKTARECGVHWFASCWDPKAVEFIEQFEPDAHKVASAVLTDADTLAAITRTGRPVFASTGMCTQDQVDLALVNKIRNGNWALLHCNSSYPCMPADVNLRCIQTLQEAYPTLPVGYSGHEVGLQISLAAVALGACVLERHFTLDRAMWGSDHGASVEPSGFARLVRDIRVIEQAMGDGVKRVTEGERGPMQRLRRVQA